jgi:hypothetical protein
MRFIAVKTVGRKFRCVDCIREQARPTAASAALLRDELLPCEQRVLSEYRAFTLGTDGHFTGSEEMLCFNDGEAPRPDLYRMDTTWRSGAAIVLL